MNGLWIRKRVTLLGVVVVGGLVAGGALGALQPADASGLSPLPSAAPTRWPEALSPALEAYRAGDLESAQQFLSQLSGPETPAALQREILVVEALCLLASREREQTRAGGQLIAQLGQQDPSVLLRPEVARAAGLARRTRSETAAALELLMTARAGFAARGQWDRVAATLIDLARTWAVHGEWVNTPELDVRPPRTAEEADALRLAQLADLQADANALPDDVGVAAGAAIGLLTAEVRLARDPLDPLAIPLVDAALATLPAGSALHFQADWVRAGLDDRVGNIAAADRRYERIAARGPAALATQARRARRRLSEPQLVLDHAARVEPGEVPEVEITSRHVGSIELEIRSLDLVSWARSVNGRLGDRFLPTSGALVWRTTHTPEVSTRALSWTTPAAEALPAGAYVVSAVGTLSDGDLLRRQSLLLVTSYEAALFAGTQRGVLWVRDQRGVSASGDVVAEADFWISGAYQPTRVDVERGVGAFRLPGEARLFTDKRFLVVGRVSRDGRDAGPILVAGQLRDARVGVGGPTQVSLVAAPQQVRVGESLRVVGRLLSAEGWPVVGDEPVTVDLIGAGDRVVAGVVAEVDARGAFDVALSLPAELAARRYALSVRHGGRRVSLASGRAAIEVSRDADQAVAVHWDARSHLSLTETLSDVDLKAAYAWGDSLAGRVVSLRAVGTRLDARIPGGVVPLPRRRFRLSLDEAGEATFRDVLPTLESEAVSGGSKRGDLETGGARDDLVELWHVVGAVQDVDGRERSQRASLLRSSERTLADLEVESLAGMGAAAYRFALVTMDASADVAMPEFVEILQTGAGGVGSSDSVSRSSSDVVSGDEEVVARLPLIVGSVPRTGWWWPADSGRFVARVTLRFSDGSQRVVATPVEVGAVTGGSDALFADVTARRTASGDAVRVDLGVNVPAGALVLLRGREPRSAVVVPAFTGDASRRVLLPCDQDVGTLVVSVLTPTTGRMPDERSMGVPSIAVGPGDADRQTGSVRVVAETFVGAADPEMDLALEAQVREAERGGAAQVKVRLDVGDRSGLGALTGVVRVARWPATTELSAELLGGAEAQLDSAAELDWFSTDEQTRGVALPRPQLDEASHAIMEFGTTLAVTPVRVADGADSTTLTLDLPEGWRAAGAVDRLLVGARLVDASGRSVSVHRTVWVEHEVQVGLSVPPRAQVGEEFVVGVVLENMTREPQAVSVTLGAAGALSAGALALVEGVADGFADVAPLAWTLEPRSRVHVQGLVSAVSVGEGEVALNLTLEDTSSRVVRRVVTVDAPEAVVDAAGGANVVVLARSVWLLDADGLEIEVGADYAFKTGDVIEVRDRFLRLPRSGRMTVTQRLPATGRTERRGAENAPPPFAELAREADQIVWGLEGALIPDPATALSAAASEVAGSAGAVELRWRFVAYRPGRGQLAAPSIERDGARVRVAGSDAAWIGVESRAARSVLR